jgi:hypothetical protein
MLVVKLRGSRSRSQSAPIAWRCLWELSHTAKRPLEAISKPKANDASFCSLVEKLAGSHDLMISQMRIRKRMLCHHEFHLVDGEQQNDPTSKKTRPSPRLAAGCNALPMRKSTRATRPVFTGRCDATATQRLGSVHLTQRRNDATTGPRRRNDPATLVADPST